MRSDKQVPYKKRKRNRKDELRLHIVWIVTAVAALALIVVLIAMRSGGKDSTQAGSAAAQGSAAAGGTAAVDASGNGSQAGGAAAGGGTSADDAVSGAAGTEAAASGTSAAAAEETPTPTPTEAPKPTAIPIDEQERVVTDVSGDWRLILVNPKHMLPEDFYVDTAEIGFADDDEMLIDERIADLLDEMLYDCREAGCSPVVRAGYRSQATQEYLYEEKIQEWIDDEGYSREEAEEVASTIVAYPGTSEHQLGLSADIADRDFPYLNASQADSPTQQWLMEHCQEYGFILRFPDGKSDLTGIIFEPWHYRYVGKEAAAEIMERGICLEEYLAEREGAES